MAIQPNFMEKFIPGITGNTATASGNVGQLLSGMPSTSNARKKAAYFGAASGMPGSGVANAFGYDLYNQEAEANKQRGFDNLLKMLTSYSGTVAPTTGQQIQASQFDQDLAFRKQQAGAERATQQRRLDEASKPKKYGRYQVGPGPVPGGFTEKEWWA